MTLMTHPSPIPWLYEMHPENGRVYHFPCFGPDPNAGHLDPAAAKRSPGRRPTPRPVHPRRVSQREHAGESLIKALLDAKPPLAASHSSTGGKGPRNGPSGPVGPAPTRHVSPLSVLISTSVPLTPLYPHCAPTHRTSKTLGAHGFDPCSLLQTQSKRGSRTPLPGLFSNSVRGSALNICVCH